MKTLNRYIALWLSGIFSIRAKKGIVKNLRLYGNIFYNKRKSTMYFEEKLYSKIPDLGGTIIEAGAHIGCYTLYFGKYKEHSRVVSFEPNQQNFRFLKKNILRNSLKNVKLVNMGLGNKIETQTFVSDRFVTSTGSFRKEKQNLFINSGKKISKQNAELTTVDRWVADHNLENVYFIKVDTEGFEPFVIEGAIQTIKRDNPLLFFEIHGLTNEDKFNDFIQVYNFLLPLDYEIYNSNNKEKITDKNIESLYKGAFIAYQKGDTRFTGIQTQIA